MVHFSAAISKASGQAGRGVQTPPHSRPKQCRIHDAVKAQNKFNAPSSNSVEVYRRHDETSLCILCNLTLRPPFPFTGGSALIEHAVDPSNYNDPGFDAKIKSMAQVGTIALVVVLLLSMATKPHRKDAPTSLRAPPLYKGRRVADVNRLTLVDRRALAGADDIVPPPPLSAPLSLASHASRSFLRAQIQKAGANWDYVVLQEQSGSYFLLESVMKSTRTRTRKRTRTRTHAHAHA